MPTSIFPRSARTVRGEVRRSDPKPFRRGRGYRHLGLLGAWLLCREVQGEDDPVASLILSLAAVSTSKAVSGLPRRRPRRREPSHGGPAAEAASLIRGGRCEVTAAGTAGRPSAALRQVLVPLALAQFICSFAGSNMNVMINDISEDLDTTVQGVQVAITIFLLVMAALMIPGGKLTDRYGRKRLLHRRARRLRRRRPAERGRPRPRRPHPGQLDPGGGRHGAADPARLHPHHPAASPTSPPGPAPSG